MLFLTRKQLFAVHGWLGMNFGLLLALICLSGAIATLTHEIEWAAQPALRIEPDGPVRWQETYQVLQQKYPDRHVVGFGRGSSTVLESMAWEGQLTRADGQFQDVRVDPYEARVVREPSRLYLTDYVRQLHYNFFSSYGFYLVCFIGLPLVLSVVSGLLFYRRWWRHLFRLEWEKGTHAFWSSLHRLLGVWTLIFGLVIGLTGLWYLAEADIVPYSTVYPPTPTVSADVMAQHGPTPEPRPVTDYIAAAQDTFPRLEPTEIYLSGSSDAAVTVQGNAERWFVRDRANAVFLDPYTAEVIDVRRSDEMDALSWWIQAVDSFHFGYWGGLATKLLWAFMGLCLPVSVLSGAYLSWRRSGVIGPKSRSGTGDESSAPPWWRRYPVRVWILAPLAVVLGVLAVQGYVDRQPAMPSTVHVADRTVGPWRVEIEREKTVFPGRTTDFFVRFRTENGGRPSFEEAHLSLRTRGEGASNKTELSGPPKAMRAAVPTPARVDSADTLALTVEGWNDQTYRIDLTTRMHEAPQMRLAEGESKPAHTDLSLGPAGPITFYLVVGGYALLSLAMVLGWVVVDKRPSPNAASGGPRTDKSSGRTAVSEADIGSVPNNRPTPGSDE